MISVLSFGATPGSPRDATYAFQQAINAAKQKGEPVFVPAGPYEFYGSLVLDSEGVSLQGEGCGPFDPLVSPVVKPEGTVLRIHRNTFEAPKPFITLLAGNTAVRDLTFVYPEQTSWGDPGAGTTGPKVYPPTIRTHQTSVIERSTFCNGWHDIEILSGRSHVKHCNLGGLKYALTIDNSWDINYIDHCVVSCFCGWGFAYPPPQPMLFWMWNNAVGITLKKADGVSVNDVLVFGRHRAISLEASPMVPDGAVSGFASNINIDSCQYGVVAQATEERVGMTFSTLLLGPTPEAAPGVPTGQYAIWLPTGDPARRPIVNVKGGSIRHLWKPGNWPTSGVNSGFQVDRYPGGAVAGDLYVKDMLGYDLGVRR